MAMQVDLGISRLLLAASGRTTGFSSNAADPAEMAGLANRYASQKLGLAPASSAGAYVPVYETTERVIEEEVFEKRDYVATEGIYEERAIAETRNIYETRAVYEDRAILETKVQGTKTLTQFDSLSEAEIASGSAFTLTVGDGATATVKFESSSGISVMVAGATQQFTFNSGDGSFRTGLVDALNSIDGLSASLSTRGRLLLETSDGQSLVIADVAKRKGEEWVGSPLRKLGLTAGVTTAEVTGYERVQTGTEQVVVGSEQVTVGVERVKVGEESVVIGSGFVKTGTISRSDGYDHKLVGLEQPERYGAGVLGSLEGIGGRGLPANYVEALFGVLDFEEREAAVGIFESEPREAGDEVETLSGEPAYPRELPASDLPRVENSGADTTSS